MARIVPDNPLALQNCLRRFIKYFLRYAPVAFPPTVEPLRVSFSISSLRSGHPRQSDAGGRAHGRAKVEQCRTIPGKESVESSLEQRPSNCREQRPLSYFLYFVALGHPCPAHGAVAEEAKAEAGIQNDQSFNTLDSGSALRFARNDSAFRLSKRHYALTSFLLVMPDNPLLVLDIFVTEPIS